MNTFAARVCIIHANQVLSRVKCARPLLHRLMSLLRCARNFEPFFSVRQIKASCSANSTSGSNYAGTSAN